MNDVWWTPAAPPLLKTPETPPRVGSGAAGLDARHSPLPQTPNTKPQRKNKHKTKNKQTPTVVYEGHLVLLPWPLLPQPKTPKPRHGAAAGAPAVVDAHDSPLPQNPKQQNPNTKTKRKETQE
jgi:hypothetical protein